MLDCQWILFYNMYMKVYVIHTCTLVYSYVLHVYLLPKQTRSYQFRHDLLVHKSFFVLNPSGELQGKEWRKRLHVHDVTLVLKLGLSTRQDGRTVCPWIWQDQIKIESNFFFRVRTFVFLWVLISWTDISTATPDPGPGRITETHLDLFFFFFFFLLSSTYPKRITGALQRQLWWRGQTWLHRPGILVSSPSWRANKKWEGGEKTGYMVIMCVCVCVCAWG